MCALDSITRWAAAAARSGNVWWMTGATAPDSSSGQTRSRRTSAIAPFSATVRRRRVEPADRQPALKNDAHVDLRQRAADESDLDQAAVDGQRLGRFRRGSIAADHIENHLDAAPVGYRSRIAATKS